MDDSTRAMDSYGVTNPPYTLATCYNLCTSYNYQYWAMENGNECHCSNKWTKIIQYSSTTCGLTGGGWALRVYEDLNRYDFNYVSPTSGAVGCDLIKNNLINKLLNDVPTTISKTVNYNS